MSEPLRPMSGRSNHPTPRSPVRNLLQGVYAGLAKGLAQTPEGPVAAWGPDHEWSANPSAQRLRRTGHSFNWVAVTFPGWSLWHLHLGLVPRGPDALALGVHWHDAVTGLLPAGVLGLAAHAVASCYTEESGEHQADVLVLAYNAFTHRRAIQILSDAALDLARGLDAPPAAVPTALSAI